MHVSHCVIRGTSLCGKPIDNADRVHHLASFLMTNDMNRCPVCTAKITARLELLFENKETPATK